MFSDIEFKSQNASCRGRLYKPSEAKTNGAGIVIAHGLCGTMDSGLFEYAEAFAKAGFHALVFDYRGFGISDGKPRQLVSVPKQRADWKAAISFLRSNDGVDADRIGLWGISFSGGHVIHLSHIDARIRAVVSQVPAIDPVLAANVGNYQRGTEASMELQGQILARLKSRWFGKPAEMLKVAPDGKNGAAVLGSKEALVYPKIAGPSWRNELHPDSFLKGKFEENNASLLTDDLTTPILLQMGEKDRVVSNEAIRNFARRCGPLATLSCYDGDHFTLLHHKAKRKKAINEAAQFYANHLIS